jgi:phosphoglycolate phosphatase
LKKRLLIFDFDGTLADSFDLFIEIFDEAAALHQFDPFDRGRLEFLRTLDAASFLKYHRVPRWKLPLLAWTTRKKMASRIESIRLFPGVAEGIARLRNNGLILALVTSNSKRNALKALGPGMSQNFDHMECNLSLLGKRAALSRILKHASCLPSEAMLIGDELRDMHAAKSVNISFGAVAWGYTSIDTLAKAGAHTCFESVAEMTSKLMQPSVLPKIYELPRSPLTR